MTQLTRRSVLVGLAATGASGVAGASPSVPPDAYRSATELAAALAARQISARELLEAEITRIETLDPTINAVVVRDFDRAREAAGAADLALGRGERGPLLGIPMTVKEQFNVAGLPTTWGIERFRDWRPTEDALAGTAAEGGRRDHYGQDQCAGGFGGLAERQPYLRNDE